MERKKRELDLSAFTEDQKENATEEPKTPEDYERILFSDPNNSLLWIKYMAYWVSVAEIQRARDTAEKALQVRCTSLLFPLQSITIQQNKQKIHNSFAVNRIRSFLNSAFHKNDIMND
jgi:hypothetical protein